MAVAALVALSAVSYANAQTSANSYGFSKKSANFSANKAALPLSEQTSSLSATGISTIPAIFADDFMVLTTGDFDHQEPAKPLTPLQKWLERLADHESNDRADITVLDHNGRYSYGCLQFQMQTFRAYTKLHGLLPSATDDHVYLKFIYNCDFQKKLARMMLADSYENWRHWSYTVRTKTGMPPPANKDDRAILSAE